MPEVTTLGALFGQQQDQQPETTTLGQLSGQPEVTTLGQLFGTSSATPSFDPDRTMNQAIDYGAQTVSGLMGASRQQWAQPPRPVAWQAPRAVAPGYEQDAPPIQAPQLDLRQQMEARQAAQGYQQAADEYNRAVNQPGAFQRPSDRMVFDRNDQPIPDQRAGAVARLARSTGDPSVVEKAKLAALIEDAGGKIPEGYVRIPLTPDKSIGLGTAGGTRTLTPYANDPRMAALNQAQGITNTPTGEARQNFQQMQAAQRQAIAADPESWFTRPNVPEVYDLGDGTGLVRQGAIKRPPKPNGPGADYTLGEDVEAFGKTVKGETTRAIGGLASGLGNVSPRSIFGQMLGGVNPQHTNPLQQWGEEAKASGTKDLRDVDPNRQGFISKQAAGLTSSLAIPMLTGPAAPFTAGAMTAGRTQADVYDQLIAQGVSPEEARQRADLAGLGAGAVSGAAWAGVPAVLGEVAPGLMAPTGNVGKLIAQGSAMGAGFGVANIPEKLIAAQATGGEVDWNNLPAEIIESAAMGAVLHGGFHVIGLAKGQAVKKFMAENRLPPEAQPFAEQVVEKAREQEQKSNAVEPGQPIKHLVMDGRPPEDPAYPSLAWEEHKTGFYPADASFREVPENNFVPAFRDERTGIVYAGGNHHGEVPLPEEIQAAMDAEIDKSALLPDWLDSGFTKGNRFYTRAEVTQAIKGKVADDEEGWEQYDQPRQGPEQQAPPASTAVPPERTLPGPDIQKGNAPIEQPVDDPIIPFIERTNPKLAERAKSGELTALEYKRAHDAMKAESEPPAPPVEELNKTLESLGISKRVVIEPGVNPRHANAIIGALQDIVTNYPAAAEAMKNSPLRKLVIKQGGIFDWSHPLTGIKGMHDALWKKLTVGGQRGDTPEERASTVRHEIGHALIEPNPLMYGGRMPEFRKAFADLWKTKTPLEWGSKLYGLDDKAEFAAEAFNRYVTGDRLPPEMQALYEKFIPRSSPHPGFKDPEWAMDLAKYRRRAKYQIEQNPATPAAESAGIPQPQPGERNALPEQEGQKGRRQEVLNAEAGGAPNAPSASPEIESAKQTAKQIGYELHTEEDGPHVVAHAKAANDAIAKVKAAGFPIPSKLVLGSHPTFEAGNTGVYEPMYGDNDPKGGLITINSKEFTEKYQLQKHVVGGGTSKATILHELAHWLYNRDNTQNATLIRLKHLGREIKGWDPSTAKLVSNYAATDPAEFVAETFAGLALGEVYAPEVYAMYEKLEGPGTNPKLDGPKAIQTYQEMAHPERLRSAVEEPAPQKAPPTPLRGPKGPALPLPPLHEDISPGHVQHAWSVASARYPKIAEGVKRIEPLPYTGPKENTASFNPETGVLRVNPDKPLSVSSLMHELTHTAQGLRGKETNPSAFNTVEEFDQAVEAPARARGEAAKGADELPLPSKSTYTPLPAEWHGKKLAGNYTLSGDEKLPGVTGKPTKALPPQWLNQFARIDSRAKPLADAVRAKTDEILNLPNGMLLAPKKAIEQARAELGKNTGEGAAVEQAKTEEAAAVETRKQAKQRMETDRAAKIQGIEDRLRELWSQTKGGPKVNSADQARKEIPAEHAVHWGRTQPNGSEGYLLAYLRDHARDDPRGTKYKWVEPKNLADGAKIKVGNETMTIDRLPSGETMIEDGITAEVDPETPIPAREVIEPKAEKTLAMKSPRFETGKKLSREEKTKVLESVRDVYHDHKLKRDELKGHRPDSGDPYYGYPHRPDLFSTSDITGRKIRHYITLPDGRKAHPTELYPNLKQSEIDRHFNEHVAKERDAEYATSQKDLRVAEDRSAANQKYNQTRRPLEGSFFMQHEDGRVVRVDGSDPADIVHYEEAGFKRSAAPKFFSADEAGASKQGSDLFGGATFENATGSKTGAMFHEPVDVPRPASAKIGSEEANKPENTGEMFGMRAAGEKPPAPGEELGMPAPGGTAGRTVGKNVPPRERKPVEPAKESNPIKEQLVGDRSFVGRDVVPAGASVYKVLSEAADSIKSIFSPQTRSNQAREEALLLREKGGELARKTDQAEHALRQLRGYLDRNDAKKNYEIVDQIEHGDQVADPRVQPFVKVMRELLDGTRDEIRALGTGKLAHFIENYFPHIWKDPKEAEGVFAKLVGRKPMEGPKSFLKQRTLPTFKEGLEAGLKPISDNPVDLVLLKLREMHRYLLAQRHFADMKEHGLMKFIPAFERPPEGYAKLEDRMFTVHGPPTIPVSEYVDEHVYDTLEKVASTLGVSHERKMSAGRGRLGFSVVGGDQIVSKFGSGTQVIAHELGHQLDEKYGLWNKLLQRDSGKGHKPGRSELRDIADLTGREEYARKKEEKIAQVLEAYIHARQRMEEVAPRVFKWFDNFIRSTPELAPLADALPNLKMKELEGQVAHGGMLIMGNYHAPEPVARVLNNHLAPGLRAKSGLFRAYLGANNVLNQAQLGLSFFHGGFTTMDSMISQFAVGLQHVMAGRPVSGLVKMATAPLAPISSIWNANKVIKEWFKPGSQGEAVGKMVDQIISAGGRVRQDPFYTNKMWDRMMTEFRKRNLFGAAVRFPWAAIEKAAAPVMEWYVPRMKIGLFMQQADVELKNLGPEATPDQTREALSRAWDSIDNRMGQVVYDNLFWDRTAKDLSMASVRSLGWNLGTWRELGGGVTDTARAVAAGGMGKGEWWRDAEERGKTPMGAKERLFTSRMAYGVSAVMMTGLAGGLMYYLMHGKPPEEMKDYFFPKTGETDKNGHPVRLALPTYLKDVEAYRHGFARTLGHKAAPLISGTIEMLNNEDFYGTKIRNEDDPIVKQALDVAKHWGEQMLPFSVRGYKQLDEEQAPMSKKILPFVGITQVSPRQSLTPAEELAEKLHGETLPRGSRTTEQADRSKVKAGLYREMKKDIDAGKGFAGSAGQHGNELEKSGTLRRDEVEEQMKRTTTDPLSYRIQNLNAADSMRIWNASDAGERQRIRDEVQQKIVGDRSLELAKKKELVNQIGGSVAEKEWAPDHMRELERDLRGLPKEKVAEQLRTQAPKLGLDISQARLVYFRATNSDLNDEIKKMDNARDAMNIFRIVTTQEQKDLAPIMRAKLLHEKKIAPETRKAMTDEVNHLVR